MKIVNASVISVDSGADITVKDGRWVVPCHLSGIEIPAEVKAEAKANLKTLTESGSVSIKIYPLVEADPEGIRDRSYNGAVSSGGVCCQLAQLEAGMARCVNDEAPETWQDAQKAAQKAKKGYWK